MARSKNLLKGNNIFIVPSNEENLWEEPWNIHIKGGEKEMIGTVSFAGEKAMGTVPISIEIPDKHYRNRGFGTEALRLMTEWAFYHRNVFEIKTTAEHENSAYIMALQKAGFVLRGGTRFIEDYSITKPPTSWTGLYVAIGIVIGLAVGILLSNVWGGLVASLIFCAIAGGAMDYKERKYKESVTGGRKL